MLKFYGSILCKDCEEFEKQLTEKGILFTFCDFKDDLSYLKEFLKIRDHCSLFDHARHDNQIGIPCLILEDQTITLDWEEYLRTH